MKRKPEDPRRTITPDAFSVAPGLLGIPLAPPWRRAAAMAVDLLLIALLANARGVFLALAAGLFLFWLAVRGRKETTSSKATRAGLGCLGATAVTITLLATLGPRLVPDDAVVFRTDTPGGTSVPVSIGSIADLVALSSAGDSAERAAAARRLLERYQSEGMTPAEMRDVVAELSSAEDFDPALQRLLVRTIDEVEGTSGDLEADSVPASLDSLLTGFRDARRSGDSVAIGRLREALVAEIAAPELAAKAKTNRELLSERDVARRQLAEARTELESERQKGFRHTITNLLDEFGLGLGWSGLYFTFMTGFFRGRTPGKRLLRVRVVRLDGRPLGFWASLERFGGYAAALFTGFEGFLKILWDPNRQGIQDKIAETVVVFDIPDTRAQLEEVETWGPSGRPGRQPSRPPAPDQARAGTRTDPRPPSTAST